MTGSLWLTAGGIVLLILASGGGVFLFLACTIGGAKRWAIHFAWMAILLALVAIAMIVGAARAKAGIQLAHGDAAWIMADKRYVTKLGTHCCGPSDCERMPADVQARLKPIPGGWELDGLAFKHGERGLYASIDSGWWWCRMAGPRCLFEPQMGS